VNDAGKQGVQLNADEYGGILGIYNKAGEPHVGLSAFKTGELLNIYNDAGEMQMDCLRMNTAAVWR